MSEEIKPPGISRGLSISVEGKPIEDILSHAKQQSISRHEHTLKLYRQDQMPPQSAVKQWTAQSHLPPDDKEEKPGVVK